MNEGSKALLALLGIVAAIVIGYVWGGYVFSVLWAWFIVTTFSVAPLGVAQSIGVMMVVGYATKRMPEKKKDGDSDIGHHLSVAIFLPLLVLAVAWIVKQWLPA